MQVVSLPLDFFPIISAGKMLLEGLMGKDLITGDKLSDEQIALTVVTVVCGGLLSSSALMPDALYGLEEVTVASEQSIIEAEKLAKTTVSAEKQITKVHVVEQSAIKVEKAEKTAAELEVVEKYGAAVEVSGSEYGYEYLNEQLGSLYKKVNVNQYQSAESVNEWWAGEGYVAPPYTPKTVVQDITLKRDMKFVRVYDGETSGLKGGWIMREEDIKGLTPKQIQEKYALPATPKYIGEVKLKVGTTLRMGETNPNFGFKGGGIQFDLKNQYVGEFKEIGKLSEWSLGKTWL